MFEFLFWALPIGFFVYGMVMDAADKAEQQLKDSAKDK